MARLVSGVSVVVARAADGRPIGMTASSVTSLSLVPPMVLVCVDHEADIHEAITKGPLFGVSVLAAHQSDLAERFATTGRQRFDGLDTGISPAGLPSIRGAIAHLECRRDAVYPAGDHSIVTGIVEWSAVEDGGLPLCYFRSAYGGLSG